MMARYLGLVRKKIIMEQETVGTGNTVDVSSPPRIVRRRERQPDRRTSLRRTAAPGQDERQLKKRSSSKGK